MNKGEKIKIFTKLIDKVELLIYRDEELLDSIERRAKMFLRKFFPDNPQYIKSLEDIQLAFIQGLHLYQIVLKLKVGIEGKAK